MPASHAARLPPSVPRRLFHVTTAENLRSILENGLLTATNLVQSAGLADSHVRTLLDAPRREPAWLDHPAYGRVWIRDQRRMSAAGLDRMLDDGMNARDWCRLLNGMVFFFPTEAEALAMSTATRYRATLQVLLALDTARLVEDFGTQVKVATFNTGSTSQGGARKRRGRSSFVPALRYTGTTRAIREVIVASDVLHIDHYLTSHRALS